MAKFIERHIINDSITLFKQENSSRWYTRFKIDNKWYTRATKEKEIEPAKFKAIQMHAEFTSLIENNLPVRTTRKNKQQGFRVIADLAINRMEQSIKSGAKSKRLKQYISAIENYLKPFFKDCMFRDVDEVSLAKLDKWRAYKMGKVPAKDTIKDHNIALQKIFDEAVIQKCITQTELPELTNTGRVKDERSFFTKAEFKIISEEAYNWIEEGRTKLSRDIRLRLYYYILLAAYSGVRPGTEMDNIVWDDFDTDWDEEKSVAILYVKIRKGKTTKFTGDRHVMCKNEMLHKMEKLILDIRRPKAQGTEKVFGDTREFGKNFTRLLKKLDLKNSRYGERTIYSLRHSYITWELLDGTPILAIADQCGTSPQMISDFYSHVKNMDYTEIFAGKHTS